MYNNTIKTFDGKIEIYNSFTKARIQVEDECFLDSMIEQINTGNDMCEDNANVSILKSNGFIVDVNLDERNALKYMYYKRYFSGKELGLILMPTMKCNFACPYCFEQPSSNQIEIENPNYFDIVEQMIAKKGKNYRIVNLSFFGGEPLLKKREINNFSNKVARLSKEIGFTLSSTVVTNGSLLDEDVIHSMMLMGCKLIQITLDGSQEQHNKTRIFKDGRPTFELLINKIEMAARLLINEPSVTLLVRFNLNNTTVKEVNQSLNRIDKRYRHRISLLFRTVFNTASYHENNTTSVDSLDIFNELGHQLGYKIYKNHRTFSSCEACSDWNFMHILPDMSLWKCVNNLNVQEACIGSLSGDGSLVLNTNNILNWYKCSDFFMDKKCQNCSLAPDCLGGCIMYNLRNGKRKCASLVAMSSIYKCD